MRSAPCKPWERNELPAASVGTSDSLASTSHTYSPSTSLSPVISNIANNTSILPQHSQSRITSCEKSVENEITKSARNQSSKVNWDTSLGETSAERYSSPCDSNRSTVASPSMELNSMAHRSPYGACYNSGYNSYGGFNSGFNSGYGRASYFGGGGGDYYARGPMGYGGGYGPMYGDGGGMGVGTWAGQTASSLGEISRMIDVNTCILDQIWEHCLSLYQKINMLLGQIVQFPKALSYFASAASCAIHSGLKIAESILLNKYQDCCSSVLLAEDQKKRALNRLKMVASLSLFFIAFCLITGKKRNRWPNVHSSHAKGNIIRSKPSWGEVFSSSSSTTPFAA
eukprot:GHVL01018367.1.p1 GENE.GHVL01018367.1~~GHVL01018367.1.p1  ORF type:complete len:341 (-),score=43.50 GHVL01018367.1:131-1153(-)